MSNRAFASRVAKTSSVLDEETKQMELRLALLKDSMKEERKKWETVVYESCLQFSLQMEQKMVSRKKQDGVIWKNARATQGNYIDKVETCFFELISFVEMNCLLLGDGRD